MIRQFLFITLLTISAFADCDPLLMKSIRLVEGHPALKEYPYIISFNDKNDAAKVKGYLKNGWLDERTFNCLTLDYCTELTTALETKLGIKNFDLGVHQIHRPSHPQYHLYEYFDFKKSENIACEIIKDLYKQYGWSWQTIARYHTGKARLAGDRLKRNNRYANNVRMNYEKLIDNQ